MKHFKSSTKLRQKEKEKELQTSPKQRQPTWYPTGPDYTSRLDKEILKRIFALVCPHSRDKSHKPLEETYIVDGCSVCDLRDLSNCCLVKRSWYGPAAGLLYYNIRIDAVHFCELEAYFQEQRERKSRRSRHAEAPDPPTLRLQLLQRTLKESEFLWQSVTFLKTPYMTRETCQAELARCVSVVPNLQYIDLPDGCYSGDSLSSTLTNELMSRCRHIRQMKYRAGAERNFEQLERGHWPELQILDISGIHVEPAVFRQVVGSLRYLKELLVTEADWFGDQVFHSAPGIPHFPALSKLTLKHVPVSIDGLLHFLNDGVARGNLTHLTISGTHIRVPDLHKLLKRASDLVYLNYTDSVSMSLPIDPIAPLQSISLRTLHYEITSASDNSQSLHPPTASYYTYLQNSLQNGFFPGLRSIYVRDSDFPARLLLAPPAPAFKAAPAPRLTQPLEVYTKGQSEMEWVYTSVIPSDTAGRRGSMSGGRPISQYEAEKGLGSQWGGSSRRSTMVGNGFGGFLVVPDMDDGARPSSRGSAFGGSVFGGSPATSPMRSEFNLRPPERSSLFGGKSKRDSRDLWR
ncbi:hypothetical protein EJ05DRAFT_443041 [Pseudovirgaria hyperparasitica]|uniref:F-box domain-containing protein n=1 Tax=Pseudovirgaria hyperparasitica TaxID=470096 RepID=A0A6A6VYD6_9PEZI|nr:uncharacterized protein EJ05DRAFT_443041 [Pseudovirgaria hyperparasitica]KAF2754836.1 hypothetical protein EJ05DRAFT_443041 [Pseudovirgaria hyperparasitica]